MCCRGLPTPSTLPRRKPIDLAAPWCSGGSRRAVRLPIFFWAAFMLGLRYLAGIPSILAALFYASTAMSSPIERPKEACGHSATSVRLGTQAPHRTLRDLGAVRHLQFVGCNSARLWGVGADGGAHARAADGDGQHHAGGGSVPVRRADGTIGRSMSESAEVRLSGTPASAGVAVGPAIVIDSQAVVVPDLEDPAAAFSEASAAVSRQLEAMCETARAAGRHRSR